MKYISISAFQRRYNSTLKILFKENFFTYQTFIVFIFTCCGFDFIHDMNHDVKYQSKSVKILRDHVTIDDCDLINLKNMLCWSCWSHHIMISWYMYMSWLSLEINVFNKHSKNGNAWNTLWKMKIDVKNIFYIHLLSHKKWSMN